MTAHKHFKQLVRERMKKTGERYAAARRRIVEDTQPVNNDPMLRWHLPGSIPATTALRILLTHAGIIDPANKKPLSEPLLFALAGGIGCGACQFHYEKENFSSLCVAGRHLWADDVAYLSQACERIGVKPLVRETSSPKAAEKQLREALEHGPCIAWVDSALLPHRAMPASCTGGGYHVVTIYKIDDTEDRAWIGDLSDQPIPISLKDLTETRLRIKKQKNRLLSVSEGKGKAPTAEMLRAGLKACHAGLTGSPMKGYPNMFNLNSFKQLAERMHGSKDKDNRWERVFPPGPLLLRGLTSLHDFIEHYGTGGGLCRPIFADGLAQASAALKDIRLSALSSQYAEIGTSWSALADAALPDGQPQFAELKELLARKAELTAAGDPKRAGEIRDIFARIDEIERQCGKKFPLSETACDGLRADLQAQLRAIHHAEVEAHAALGEALK